MMGLFIFLSVNFIFAHAAEHNIPARDRLKALTALNLLVIPIALA